MRRHLDALFVINVFKGKISYLSVLDTVSLHIPTIIAVTKLHASRAQQNRTTLQHEQRSPDG
jgi:hypothetical protein